MRVAVIGANGQLGTDLCAAYRVAGDTVIELTHADVDVRDRDVVQRMLGSLKLDVVVNTAAMHNLDACQADPAAAVAVNTTGPTNIALAGQTSGFKLVHVSTDYVFDGNKDTPYVETDEPAPLNVYGKTKLDGERRVVELLPASFIVRTSGLYGTSPCRAKPSGNFVQLMRRLGREKGEVRVVTDEIVTPTFTEDLAQQIVTLSAGAEGQYGVYHATCQGETTWFDFARAIFDISGMDVRMSAGTMLDFPQKTPRPKYSVLDNERLRRAGLDVMPHWRDSLTRYLAYYS